MARDARPASPPFARVALTALALVAPSIPGSELRADEARPSVGSSASAPHATAMYRATFPYRDAELLSFGEFNGGEVVVPSRVPLGDRAPLVVLLHGVNVDRGPHMWLTGKTEPDLAPLVERLASAGSSRPFVFAAPSQTRSAWSGHMMWKDFDLDDFVRAVDDAIAGRASVDPQTVIVLGHSGGGCNPDGGLLRVARVHGRVVPRALVAVDTCLDEEAGAALGAAPAGTEVWVRWQAEIWPRPLDRFRASFRDTAAESGRDEPQVQRVDGLGPGAHDAILLDTLTSLVPLLVASAGEGDGRGASDP